jgi:hypothetical protein
MSEIEEALSIAKEFSHYYPEELELLETNNNLEIIDQKIRNKMPYGNCFNNKEYAKSKAFYILITIIHMKRCPSYCSKGLKTVKELNDGAKQALYWASQEKI